jgi:hypothetical protein
VLLENANNIRVLKHLLAYVENQFGDRIAGKGYRKRSDGERINNWKVGMLHNLNGRLAHLYGRNNLLASTVRDDMIFPYLERSLSLFNPWLINGIDDLNKGQIEELINYLAIVTMDRRQFDKSEGHCQRLLAYSRRLVEGPEKTSLIFEALSTYGGLHRHHWDNSGAVQFTEEAYNLVVEAYDCVHSQVQQAAGNLISILIAKGDLYNGERYPQVTYSNIRDKKNGMDQEGEESANSPYNLAEVIYQQNGDMIKAEVLTREALYNRILIFGNDYRTVGTTCLLLARILKAQGKFGDETREIYDRSLAITIRDEGPNSGSTAIGQSGGTADIHHVIGQF